MNPLAATLARSPELSPHGLDPRGGVSIIRLNEVEYPAAAESELGTRAYSPI